MPDDGRPSAPSQLDTRVFPAELEEIRDRWRATASDGSPYTDRNASTLEKSTTPSVDHDLVGIAFSGGGIRSATFNLGIVQGLRKRRVFRHVDYMSTVSGGGYLGSSLSSQMRECADDPFAPDVEGRDSEAMTWLRNHSNYIATRGFFDYTRMISQLVRGIILHLVVILPFIALAAFAVDWLYGSPLERSPDWNFEFVTWVTPRVAAGILIFVLTYPLLGLYYRVTYRATDPSEGGGRASGLITRGKGEQLFSALLLTLAGAIILDLQPHLIYWFHELDDRFAHRDEVMGLTGAASFVITVASSRGVALLGGWKKVLTTFGAAVIGPLVPLLLYLYMAERLVFHGELTTWGLETAEFFAFVLVPPGLFCILFLDANSTSMHSFYRDRLARAYRVGHDEDGDGGPEGDVGLGELSQSGSGAPYHLVNTALNVSDKKDPSLRGRRADFFVFSKRFIGSERTGYCTVKDMERVFPHVHLATAMAISGAAAAPNMGVHTRSSLVFLMTLLNVRLGYWVPRPGKVDKWSGKCVGQAPWRTKLYTLWSRTLGTPGTLELWHEMIGLMKEDGRSVNLSDGGHLENLAVYELLRRRCRFIIAGDGEADPGMTFTGLATLIRYARIDLGVEIRIGVDDLRLGDDGTTTKHFVFGTIEYPPGPDGRRETGVLLYLKSSVTGNEDEVIKQYRSENPTFPHQSTGDQFFDEAQFEAYRSLGMHVIDEVFADVEAHGEPADLSAYKALEAFLERGASSAASGA